MTMAFPVDFRVLNFFGGKRTRLRQLQGLLFGLRITSDRVSSAATSRFKSLLLDRLKCCKINLKVPSQFRFSETFKHFGTSFSNSFFHIQMLINYKPNAFLRHLRCFRNCFSNNSSMCQKSGHELDQQFLKLILLKAFQIMMHLPSRNLHPES